MVTHVLKDGTVTDSVAGRTITQEEFPGVYAILYAVQEKTAENGSGDAENGKCE